MEGWGPIDIECCIPSVLTAGTSPKICLTENTPKGGIRAEHGRKAPLAMYLVLLATAVALHFLFEGFYADLVNTGKILDILNCFMAVPVFIALLVPLAILSK